jgi:hypothetical protein
MENMLQRWLLLLLANGEQQPHCSDVIITLRLNSEKFGQQLFIMFYFTLFSACGRLNNNFGE